MSDFQTLLDTSTCRGAFRGPFRQFDIHCALLLLLQLISYFHYIKVTLGYPPPSEIFYIECFSLQSAFGNPRNFRHSQKTFVISGILQ